MRSVVASALLVIAAPVAAQRTDVGRGDTTSADSARRAAILPAVVVTGTLAPRAMPQGKLGFSRTVIDRETLRMEPIRTSIERLRTVTGVSIDEANGPLGPAIIRLRGGEETFTQVLYDGVQANENGGFFDAQGLTLVNVDRLEVARGPQSAIYGSSAMSGVVQVVTRAGRPGPLHASVTLEGGRTSPNGGGARGIGEIEGGSDRLRYSAGIGSAYDRGPYRLAHDLKANDGSLRVDILPGSSARITAIARYMDVDSKLPVRNPGITRAPLDPNQHQRRERMLGTVEGAWAPSDRWSNALAVAGFHREFSYDDAKDGLTPSAFQFFVPDFNFRYRATVNRTTARYVGTVTPNSRADHSSITFAYGAQWERETLDDTSSGDFGSSAMSVARDGVAGFVEGQAQVGTRLNVLAGSRIERFEGLDAVAVPRVTAVVTLVPDRLSVRGGVARAYKAPNIQDQFPNNPFILANPDLKPETSSSWEIGADMTVARARGSLVYFRQDHRDLIRSVSADAAGRQMNRNLGKSRASGIEVEGELRAGTDWVVGAQGAWLATKIIDNNGLPAAQFPNGEPLPFRPSHTASGFVRSPTFHSISVTTRATTIGRQTVLSDRFRGNRVSIDPYTVLSATSSYALRGSFEAYLHVENVLGETYEAAFDKPGAPRSVVVGMRARR
jgi:vitamin B12 transporter